jgi:hypothetical protein
MRNTFSWSCSFCGEYNVVDLTGKAGPQIRCGFCFLPIQAAPGIVEGRAVELPSPPPSDDWIGHTVVQPFFRAVDRRREPPAR